MCVSDAITSRQASVVIHVLQVTKDIMRMVIIRPHYHTTIEIKSVMTSTNVKMDTHNVVTIRFVQIPKVRIIVVVGTDLPGNHRRLIVNRWKECVPMEQFAIEMLKYGNVSDYLRFVHSLIYFLSVNMPEATHLDANVK